MNIDTPHTFQHELTHLRAHWWWLMILGVLLTVCGTAAIISPPLTALLSIGATVFLGVLFMACGLATIIGAFWAGRWSGFLVQLLVGLVYLAAGLVITDKPLASTESLTWFLAVLFMMMGTFRMIGSLLMRFPQWGWALLNGIITLLAGVVIYRHLPGDALWVVGLLVGLEMLFNGWTWIMLALAVRELPETAK